ncbi:hypothetical protein [Nakamurella leprariae]|uniref:Uncharacterized protein n=1 Tax=Nakamurella leprariae TaxID=2803911 RepID=A0A939BYV0_9ACTN|nr:hypothetical protein [Nakamurella leprariae]MBM9467006.1 hypothetical protein [Nakamurella leprariae]
MSQPPDPTPFTDLEPIEIEPVDIAGHPAWLHRLPDGRTIISFGEMFAEEHRSPIREAVLVPDRIDDRATRQRYGELRERIVSGLDPDEAWWMLGDDLNVRDGDVELLLSRLAEVLTELGRPAVP